MVSDEQDEMHGDVHDEMIERIAARLRPFPEVDPAARARVLVAVAAERERDRERQRAGLRRPRVVRWAAAAVVGLAAALAFAVVLPRQNAATPEPRLVTASAPVTAAQPGATGTAAALVASDAGAAALRPVELVFRAPAASRVSVVGDFSAWDPSQAVMTRDSGSGLWTVTLRLTPGRHVYAFLVDDSIWVRDPRAPAAPDADFGRPGSVMLVGHP
jgi:hypothetical protein